MDKCEPYERPSVLQEATGNLPERNLMYISIRHAPSSHDHAPEMVYTATATLLVLCPDAVAMAFSVWLEETVMGPVYCLEDVVGVEPSVL